MLYNIADSLAFHSASVPWPARSKRLVDPPAERPHASNLPPRLLARLRQFRFAYLMLLLKMLKMLLLMSLTAEDAAADVDDDDDDDDEI